VEYRNTEFAFGVLFPQQPAVRNVTYKLPLVPNPPMARTFSSSEESSYFSLTVVDFFGREDEGASLLIEAEFYLALIGDVVLNSTSRVQGGLDATYGRMLALDCRSDIIPDQPGQTHAAHVWFKDITGRDCPDGGRVMVTSFFRQGRMYLFIGINEPVNGDAIRPAAMQFVQSVSFLNPLPAAAAQRAARGGGGRGGAAPAGGGRGGQ
jgi:hypothetical protein